MGVAILSGVVASLENRVPNFAGPSTPTLAASQLPGTANGNSTPNMPGTMTPNVNVDELPDASIPTRFLACVNRAETAKRLRATLRVAMGVLAAESVEILWRENLKAVQEADVVLLWLVTQISLPYQNLTRLVAASPKWRPRS
jgi:pyrroline-5-carboxylate reductase